MKEVKHIIKLTLPAGKATIAPPVGTVLGPAGINIRKFCDDFNNWTKNMEGSISFGVVIYDDLSYELFSKKDIVEYEKTQLFESISFLYREQNNFENSKKNK